MPADVTAVPAAVRERLRSARAFVFDMDGTLVLGDRHGHELRPLPGAHGIIKWLTGQGVPFVVLTNGTARTPSHYAGKLRAAGFDVPDEAMMTPASSAVVVCLRRGHRRVVVLGNDGLIDEGKAQQDKAEAQRNAGKKEAAAEKARGKAKAYEQRERAEQN